jgi:hypothetical protein
MNEQAAFSPLQAQEGAQVFAAAGVDYLFMGKGGVILLSFPGTTQGVAVFPAKDAENGRRLVAAVRRTFIRGLRSRCRAALTVRSRPCCT